MYVNRASARLPPSPAPEAIAENRSRSIVATTLRRGAALRGAMIRTCCRSGFRTPWRSSASFSYNEITMRYLIALLALAGIIDSYLALRIHLQDPSQAPPCSVTAKFDCGEVNHGRYAVFPPLSFDEAPNASIHIPVAVFGIAGYALIALLALAKRYWLTLQAAEIGFFFAAFLSYLEAYVIEKWCIYCLCSMGIITAILLLTIAKLVSDGLRRRRSGSPTNGLASAK